MGMKTFVRKVTANILGLFVVGETIDLEIRRGVTQRHTERQIRRFAMVKKWITRSNVWLLWISRGRLGNSFLGRPVLLLTTCGRQSGLPRTQPLFYMEEEGGIILVASNGGDPRDPLWLSDIRAQPEVRVTRLGVAQTLRARLATDEERSVLWPRLTQVFPYWQEVADRSERIFPLVILTPQAGPDGSE